MTLLLLVSFFFVLDDSLSSTTADDVDIVLLRRASSFIAFELHLTSPRSRVSPVSDTTVKVSRLKLNHANASLSQHQTGHKHKAKGTTPLP